MTTENLRDRLVRLADGWENLPDEHAEAGWAAAQELRAVLAEFPQEDVATILMNGYESTVGPLFDTADGMRADLERRGWSPTMAEAMAASWLQSGLTSLW